MTWILVNALDNNVAHVLNYRWKYEKKKGKKLRKTEKEHPESMFIRRIHFKVYIMQNNGEVLAYLSKLKMRYGELVQLFAIDELNLRDMPESVMHVAKYLATRPRQSVREAVKNTPEVNYSIKELRECKIEYSKNLRRKPYTLQEIRALREKMAGVLDEPEK